MHHIPSMQSAGFVTIIALSLVRVTLQRPTGPQDQHLELSSHSITDYSHAPPHQSEWTTSVQLPREQTDESDVKRRKLRKKFARSVPPPPHIAHQMGLAEFVKQKEDTFAAMGSEAWIKTFALHPGILAIEAKHPRSEEYALEYTHFFDQDVDERKRKATSQKLSLALKSYFESFPGRFPEHFAEDVMLHLRSLRKEQTDRRRQQKRHSTKTEEKYVVKTEEDRADAARNFVTCLIADGVDYKGLGPKELEMQSRDFVEVYYGGDAKSANSDMLEYMKLLKVDADDMARAKLTRKGYLRTEYQKTYNSQYYKNLKKKKTRNGGPYHSGASTSSLHRQPSLLAHLFDDSDSDVLPGDPAMQQRCDAMVDELCQVMQGGGQPLKYSAAASSYPPHPYHPYDAALYSPNDLSHAADAYHGPQNRAPLDLLSQYQHQYTRNPNAY